MGGVGTSSRMRWPSLVPSPRSKGKQMSISFMAPKFLPTDYGDYNRTSAYLISWTNRHRLKRDSPFSRMQAMDLLDQDIEEHFLKNVFNPQEGLPRVHFKPEMGAHTSKNQDPPEYLRQLALEIINKIPATAMQIYTDGSKDENKTHVAVASL
ncbi:putative RNA-directed DNA polymerase from transposon BS [Trichonephila clavipes]|nr:putative RNA-directed DNA polymerase from transposon BS [Trichonephila clavipes]